MEREFIMGHVKITEYVNSNGQLHRENGPALIYTNYVTNIIEYKAYCVYGEIFKDYTYNKHNGRLVKTQYYSLGKLHRIGRPAYFYYWEDGTITERYYERGLLHNVNGPAEIFRSHKSYYLYDKHFNNKIEWKTLTNILKNCLQM